MSSQPKKPHTSSSLFSLENQNRRQEERMIRSDDIKSRIGPIMAKMKANLARIQALEESLGLADDSVMPPPPVSSIVTFSTSSKTPSSSPLPPISEHNDGDNSNEKAVTANSLATGGSGKSNVRRSRTLLKRSMEMLKKKLQMLQQTEELLVAQEDRNDWLLYVASLSLSNPASPVPASPKILMTNNNNEEKIEVLEEQVSQLTKKLENQDQFKADLEYITTQKDMLELDLVQRQTKINEQAMKIDDLECQLDQLTIMYDEVVSNLREAEVRGDNLEQDLLEAMQNQNVVGDDHNGSTANDDCTESTENSGDASSFPSTIPDLTSNSRSSCNQGSNTSAHSPQHEGGEGKGISASPAKTIDTADSSLNTTENNDDGSLLGHLPSPINIFVEDAGPGSANYVNTTDQTSLIEELQRKNALLVQSQQDSTNKYHGLLQENECQAAKIRELERKLRAAASQGGKEDSTTNDPTASPATQKSTTEKNDNNSGSTKTRPSIGRGYYIKKLWNADASELKQMIEGNE